MKATTTRKFRAQAGTDLVRGKMAGENIRRLAFAEGPSH
jgi:hypothetical protein